MGDLPRHVTTLIAQAEENLIVFLDSDMDVGFTFVDAARLEFRSDPAIAQRSLAIVRNVLETVRKFQGRIADPQQWARINDRANGLMRALEQVTRDKG